MSLDVVRDTEKTKVGGTLAKSVEREFSRVRVNWRVALYLDGRVVLGKTHDISEGDMSVLFDQDVFSSSHVELHLEIHRSDLRAKDVIPLRCRVVYSVLTNGWHRAGFRIVQMHDEHRTLYRSVIDEKRKVLSDRTDSVYHRRER